MTAEQQVPPPSPLGPLARYERNLIDRIADCVLPTIESAPRRSRRHPLFRVIPQTVSQRTPLSRARACGLPPISGPVPCGHREMAVGGFRVKASHIHPRRVSHVLVVPRTVSRSAQQRHHARRQQAGSRRQSRAGGGPCLIPAASQGLQPQAQGPARRTKATNSPGSGLARPAVGSGEPSPADWAGSAVAAGRPACAPARWAPGPTHTAKLYASSPWPWPRWFSCSGASPPPAPSSSSPSCCW